MSDLIKKIKSEIEMAIYAYKPFDDDYDEDYGRGARKGFREALKIIEREAAKEPSGWIPCSERMPEPFTPVLATAKMPGDKEWLVYIAAYVFVWTLAGVKNSGDYILLAWMPLPEPAREVTP